MTAPKAILFDLDGVLYIGDQPVPGAAAAVAWARSNDIPHLFVTNTTSRPRSALSENLASLGVPTSPESILTPAVAAAQWLRSQPEGAVALFTPASLSAEFSEFPSVEAAAESGARYVIVGDLGHLWDHPTLNRAFRLLRHDPDSRLIALGMTRYWETPTGPSLDVAPFVVALEHATGKQAVVLGKPAQPFFEAAARKLGVAPAETLMIGDDIRGDVGGAQAAGMLAALVKTGKFRSADLAASINPDAVLNSVADLPECWRRLCSQRAPIR